MIDLLRVKEVVAVGRQALDTREFGEPPICAAAGQNRDHLDGLGDQRARHGDDGFLDQLLHPAKRAECRAGMNGADATGMAGAPGLQKIERFGAAHLTDRDSVGPQPERGAHEVGQRGDAILGAQCHEIWRLALEFAGILDQHDAIGGLCDLRQQRIGERGLAGRGAAGDEDVATIPDGVPQRFGLRDCHDAGGDIVVEREDGDRRLADREGRRCHHRRQQPLKALSGLGQLGRYAGTAGCTSAPT